MPRTAPLLGTFRGHIGATFPDPGSPLITYYSGMTLRSPTTASRAIGPQAAPISGMDLFTAGDPTTAFPEPLPRDPVRLMLLWLEEARAAEATPNPDAMVLSTVDDAGEPAARVVLCKAVSSESGYLVFYTNYDSRKARELAHSSAAAATFHWDHMGRQARVRGQVVRSPAEESDAYFAMRPVLSQLGAWASRQSETMLTSDQLIAQVATAMMRFGIDIEQVISGECDQPIPRPPNWGGYRLWIRSVELWLGGLGRLHERVQWKRRLAPADDDGFAPGVWEVERLQP